MLSAFVRSSVHSFICSFQFQAFFFGCFAISFVNYDQLSDIEIHLDTLLSCFSFSAMHTNIASCFIVKRRSRDNILITTHILLYEWRYTIHCVYVCVCLPVYIFILMLLLMPVSCTPRSHSILGTHEKLMLGFELSLLFLNRSASLLHFCSQSHSHASK